MPTRIVWAAATCLAIMTATGCVDPAGSGTTRAGDDPIDHVVAISVDGLNPSAIRRLGRAGTPSFHRLIREGAATLNAQCGVVTSESITTAAAATYTLTLTNSRVSAGSVVAVNVYNGTNSAGTPVKVTETPGSGTLTVVVKNDHASAAFNGTLKFSYCVLN